MISSHLVSWYTRAVKVNVRMTSLAIAIELVHKLKREPSSSNNMELLVRRWYYDCCVSVAVMLILSDLI
jgi:hypothetical protein